MKNQGNYFPKNYHASGIGLVNLAALGYYKNEDSALNPAPKTGLYPSLPYPSNPTTDLAALTLSQPSTVFMTKSWPSCPAVDDRQKTVASQFSSAPYPTASTPYSNAPYTTASSLYPTVSTPYPPATAPYPSASSPYPSASSPYPPLPYPTSQPSSNSTLYPTSQPSSNSTLYPTMPSLPYPTSFSAMPMPMLMPNDNQLVSSGYGTLYPSYQDGSFPTLPVFDDGSNLKEEPSVGVPELLFSSVTVPENENMFWLGEKGSGLRSSSDVQDFESLRNNCLANGSLFEDPMFPANNDSLMFSRRPDRYIEWLRPHEICENPQLFVEGYSRFDVQQGELGDCWLLAAAANLTQDSSLFFRVVPPDQSFEENYAGIFHFCFWQYGKWIDVVIDDRLPTYHGELLYMHSTEKNEFWSALLEKAYAKLHGSYEALKGGTTCEAMEDFTGGVTEWYDLKEAPPNLFNILHKAVERNSMMGCSLEPDPNVLEAETSEGLIRGHAYSITKVCLIDIVTPSRQGKIPMIRMRNPWGNEAEWNGPWSDSSPEWRYIPEEQKEEIGLTFDRDGEFWMSFQDFLNHFDRVEICNLSPDSLTEDQINSGKRKWEMSMFEGEWTQGSTAGGCRNFLETFWHNPQYVISIEDPDEEDNDGKCTVIVALMQKNRRSKRNMGMECLTIGFAVYHLTDRDLETKPQGLNFFKYRASVARSPHFINTREVCSRFKLPPGHYLIVPSTFDPNEEGEFIIRVFSESKNNMEENDDQIGYGESDERILPNIPPPKAVDPQRENLLQLFKNIAGSDMEVDWMELKNILDYSMRDDIISEKKVIEENEETGGSGNLLSLLCMPFFKGTCFEDVIEPNNPQLAKEANQVIGNNWPVMHEADGKFSKDVCRSMVAMMDIDQTGKLGFEEFEALLKDVAKWKAVFKVYDSGNTGKIDGFQLRDALKSAGYHLNNRILNALAHRYGSRDGKIAFDDFLMCAVKIKTYIEIFKEKDSQNTDNATFSLDEWIQKTIYS